MPARKTRSILITVLSLLLIDSSLAQNTTGVDILTLKNGDSYNGTVAHEFFSLKTNYGVVKVPYKSMSILRLGQTTNKDFIQTHQGDYFYGQLLDKEFILLRVLGPALPIASADIHDISFTQRVSRKRLSDAHDAVETNDGIRFFGKILSNDFILKTNDSLQLLNRKDIHIIDITNLSDDQDLLSHYRLLQ